jgi:hypothetical protein
LHHAGIIEFQHEMVKVRFGCTEHHGCYQAIPIHYEFFSGEGVGAQVGKKSAPLRSLTA